MSAVAEVGGAVFDSGGLYGKALPTAAGGQKKTMSNLNESVVEDAVVAYGEPGAMLILEHTP